MALQVKQLLAFWRSNVRSVTLELNEGELVGLIGCGAGKTALFNLLTGVYEPSEGCDLDGHLP